MTRSRGSASITAASNRSVSSARTPSQPASLARSTSAGGGSCSDQTSASHAARILSSPTGGMTRVTNTFGFAIGKFLLRPRTSNYGLPGGGLGFPGGREPGGRGGVGRGGAGRGGGSPVDDGRRSGTGGRDIGGGRGVRGGGVRRG